MKSNKIHLFINAIALLLFTHQIIDLTITYCKFIPLIEISTNNNYYILPVASVCVNYKIGLSKANKSIGHYLCHKNFAKSNREIYCKESLVKSVTPSQK